MTSWSAASTAPVAATPPAAEPTPAAAPSRLETAGAWLLPLFVFVLPLSVAASGILLTALIAVWIGLLAAAGERPAVPSFFWPLAAYAGWTLVTVVFSIDPMTSLIESREVLLYLTVPVVYRLARGDRAWSITNVVLTAGALTAAIGIVQYGILEFDTLGRRPSGSMGHYMTYAGLVMLSIGVAVSRIAFGTRDRIWAALMLPALLAALAVTLTRGAWLGSLAAVGLLVVLHNRRLLLLAPVAAIVIYLVAPAAVTDRALSIFDPANPTNRDRVAMLTVGAGMVRDHPVTGVGPEMVLRRYGEYRPADAVNEVNPHLHNVPVQIAAERGLPALALWAWFVVAVSPRSRAALPASGNAHARRGRSRRRHGDAGRRPVRIQLRRLRIPPPLPRPHHPPRRRHGGRAKWCAGLHAGGRAKWSAGLQSGTPSYAF